MKRTRLHGWIPDPAADRKDFHIGICFRCAGAMRIVELGRGLQAKRCRDCGFERVYRVIEQRRSNPASRDRHERHERHQRPQAETVVYERQPEFSE